MVAFAAHTLPQPVLPQRSARSLCERALAGFCPNGEHCDRSHEICRVPDKPLDPWASTQAIPPFNVLVPEPRLLDHGPLFDHEGPGSYCEGDCRHDNDHIDIRNINILPTMDEILSLRPPYMPYKDFHRPHFLRESGENAGTSRLLDTLFRQLRYDSTEQIIDICYRACQILTFPPQEDILTSDYQFSHATPKGSRFMLFRDICFEESLFHETKGLVLRLSYACPKFLRGRWMHSSGLFEEGMLVALVGLDDIDHALSTTFFEVVLRESTDAMNARGGNGQRASIQLSFAQRNSQDDVRRMLYYSQGVLRGRFVLVDFPKLLLAGFSATLKQLQNQYHKYRLPFATHIAPSDPRSVNLKIEPPTYTKSSGFSFDLNSLRRQDARKPDLQMTSVELDLANGRPEIFREQLETATTLDQGQALALSQNLSRGLTFTQGPPGTGKSYLGVSLTKAVVSSQNGANAKPVLAVCMTNHALDSFLEDLVKDGITQVARLGAGSKVEWTKPYTLRELSHKIKLTQLESHNLLRPRIRVEALHREGTRWCESLSTSDLSWCSVRNHLTEKYPDIYRQFLALEKPEHSFEGHRAIRHAGGFGFHCWKSGLDIRALNTLSVEFATYLGVDPSTGDTSGSGTRVIESLLAEIVSRSRNLDAIVSSGTSIWSMSPTERTSMVEKWKMEIGPRKFVEQLGEIHRRHQVALLEKKKATQDIDARCLESRQVIGLTTTACATYWPLLHRLGLKVIICEEAGEVMEAHTLCTLFPSIEHAIFIGDPLQLRPQITERALSLETKGGRDYRLDESLFERLMFPSTPGVLPIQPSQLNLQRRMHPDIADISRATLYPYLQDHDSTLKHPAVVGMANRMYWFDHSHSEDPLDSRSATSKSCSNAFEVEMVAGLVQYLIAGNAYDLQDVAILTPYNGQLAALTKRLRSTCSIWLSEKDRETLVDGGFLSVEEAATGGRVQIDLINMLRIATIDNFQGEEAKIIIMSTVRSNLDDRVGFLKTKNRINVACSRARDGFYIIGNAALMRKVEMWDRIVDVFDSKKSLGSCLRTCCSRHPQRYHDVYIPSHFAAIAPCQIPCGALLACGHHCHERCHPISLHERMKCMKPCERLHEKCGHRCEKICGDRCGDCLVPLPPIQLPCGHEVSLKCSERTNEEIKCSHLIESIPLPCGHTVDDICSNKDKSFECTERCGKQLSCGHLCSGTCSICRNSSGHPPCQSYCNAERECGHKCLSLCHEGLCPPCQQPCKKSCEHGGCKRLCSSICDPCVKQCGWQCVHHGQCNTMCSLPCTRFPCGEPCTKLLPCGHLCSSLCGEICPKVCSQCTTGQLPGHSQIALACGHNFDLQLIDTHVGLSRVYSINEEGIIDGFSLGSGELPSLPSVGCPTCGGPLTEVRRYAILYKIKDTPKVLDRMIAKFGRKVSIWHRELVEREELLRAKFLWFCREISPGPGAVKSNQELVRERGNWYMDIQSRIYRFLEEVVRPFERNVLDIASLTEARIFRRPVFAFALRLELLFRRCRLETLLEARRMADFLQRQDDPTEQLQTIAKGLLSTVDEQSAQNIRQITFANEDCKERRLPALEVEFTLSQLAFFATSRRNDDEATSNAVANYDRALDLCGKFPDTAGRFFRCCRLAKRATDGLEPPEQTYAAEPRDHWRKWGKHATGHLSYCDNGHPYSTVTFDGCPECGREVNLMPAAEPVDYESYLNKDAFLQALERRVGSGSHAGGSSSLTRSKEPGS